MPGRGFRHSSRGVYFVSLAARRCCGPRPNKRNRLGRIFSKNANAIIALLFCFWVGACHQEEQAVKVVAKKAVTAEQKAQAAASVRDQERAQLAQIPLPTKSLYIDIHEPSQWANPFLSVEANVLDLRVTMADANPSSVSEGTMLRPVAARRQELQIRPSELAEAIVALPPGAWRYGRVIAVAEAPNADRKDRPKVRRNVEAAIQQLNDLGVVVEEWPGR